MNLPPVDLSPAPGAGDQDLIELLDDVVFRADAAGRWTYLSPAWEKRLRWPVADCLGRAPVKFVDAPDRAVVFNGWRDLLAGRLQNFRGEVRFRDREGGCHWMLVSARAQVGSDGTLVGIAGLLTDVTASKAVEAELIDARAAAEAANNAKNEFLSTMSHELRTPLNAVIGLSESLLEVGPPFDPDRTKRYLGIIHQSGRQLLALINDVLDFARIEAGRIKVNTTELDLGLLGGAAMEAAQREIKAKGLKTEVIRPPAPLIIRADERLLRQVVQNLVSNAVKFTPNGGRVVLTVETGAAGVTVAVRDTGIGIPAEKIPLLFRPFSQIDASLARQFAGTGLGLALVDRIVRLHGGTVGVNSVVGAGSTFTVTLPATCIAAPAAPAPGPRRARRILLVDDDPRQHVLVGDFLRHRGFEVVGCEDAASALKAVAAAEPGLAVIDLNLPGMSGLDLIARLRQQEALRGLPILVASALVEPDDISRCRAAGADAHLPKPISLNVLWQQVQLLTGHSA